MAGWLSGKRSAAVDDQPQPFELVCECNVRHSGLRRKVHQRIVCRNCGTALFVLPRNAYPAATTAKPRPEKRAASRPADAPVAATIDEVTEDLGAGEAIPGPRVSRFKRKRERDRDRQSDAARSGSPAGGVAALTSAAILSAAEMAGTGTRRAARRVSEATTTAARGFWQFWTPLKLTVLGIVILGVGGAWWMHRAQQRDEALRRLNPAIEDGLTALNQGDLKVAEARLGEAVRALDTLGHSDQQSRSTRQTHAEVQALANLISAPLLDVVEAADAVVEAEQAARASRPPPDKDAPPLPALDAEWSTRFDALYRRGWVVMEASVVRLEPTENEPHRYEVLFPVEIGPRPRSVSVRADFELFDTLEIGTTPRTVVFGGRLQRCRLSADAERWELAFDPASGFLWASLDTYRRLGFLFSDWHREEDVRALLAAQAKALDVEPFVETPKETAPSRLGAAE